MACACDTDTAHHSVLLCDTSVLSKKAGVNRPAVLVSLSFRQQSHTPPKLPAAPKAKLFFSLESDNGRWEEFMIYI